MTRMVDLSEVREIPTFLSAPQKNPLVEALAKFPASLDDCIEFWRDYLEPGTDEFEEAVIHMYSAYLASWYYVNGPDKPYPKPVPR